MTLVLECEHATERAVITRGPQVVAVDAIDQLGVDSYLIALPAHAALRHVTTSWHKAHGIESTGSVQAQIDCALTASLEPAAVTFLATAL
jgi:hypothetical protein